MKLTRVLGAIAAASALALVPAAANAGTKTHIDPAGDVRSFSMDDSNNNAGTPAPNHPNGDIRAIRVTHGPRNVRVQLNFAALNRSSLSFFSEFRIQTPKYTRLADVYAGNGAWRGTHVLTTPAGKKLTCSGMRHTVDTVHKRVVVTVPRSCLGNPRWVRVGAGGGVAEGTGIDDMKVYADDARSSTLGARIVLGPRVYKS